LNGARLLICTDLDRTLIPNGTAPESPNARERFALLAARAEVTLTYVSGRDRRRVMSAIEQYRLPVPDHVIGDVGTTIFAVGEAWAWRADAEWEETIAADWAGHDGASLAETLTCLPGLRLQEADRQGRNKLSYYTDLTPEPTELTGPVARRLESIGVDARLVWSVDEVRGVGLLDVLPRSASKYHAIRALMSTEGFTTEQTVFCGDSGNDLEVLVSPVPAVLVANADPAVREAARARAEADGFEDRLYLASGGFMGMNGNYAGGVLEGIAHYHPGIESWLDATGILAS
jgi:HAD superfamily hydrolase (TIGR01484 family)